MDTLLDHNISHKLLTYLTWAIPYPYLTLGGGWNLPELNNSKFSSWISIKFCMLDGLIKQISMSMLAQLDER